MTGTETTSAAAIDLTDFLPQDEATIEMIAPGGKQTGWMVTLAGPAHPKRIAANDVAVRKALRRAKEIDQAQITGKKYEFAEQSPEEVRREAVENTVSRIVTWTPVRMGGEIYEFSDKRAVELLANPNMGWAIAQIAEAQADESLFIRAS